MVKLSTLSHALKSKCGKLPLLDHVIKSFIASTVEEGVLQFIVLP